jgi:hypothetical protein
MNERASRIVASALRSKARPPRFMADPYVLAGERATLVYSFGDS